ncbi:MAG: dockerin type I repeat-containing protein [Muribaculaceae bacterium]|nr:dockerin type I repeat-containing protein [Muribaculaceae bacterium]
MRQIIQVFTLLMAVFYSTSAFAVVDPYTAMVITPAEGSVTSLQNFTITFDGLPVAVNENAIPTLDKGANMSQAGHMRADADGKTVIVEFPDCWTDPAQYFLNLPEGSIIVNGQTLLPLRLRYNIEGTSDEFYSQIAIDPAEGEVTSLQYFNVFFPLYVAGIAKDSMATLTNLTTHQSYQGEMYDMGYRVMVSFSDMVDNPGRYRLTIPDNSVIIYTLGEDVHELNFNYYIPGDTVPSLYDLITIDPAEGQVERLQNFTITFPQQVDAVAADSKATLTNTITGTTYQAALVHDGNKVMADFASELTEPGRYTLSIPAGAVVINALGEEVHQLDFNYAIVGGDMPSYTINPAEGDVYMLQYFTIAYGEHVMVDENVHPVLTDDGTGEQYECNLMEIGGNAVVFKEYPLSVLGNYTLTVPANCITLESNGHTNQEMTFHYTIVEKDYYVPTVIENQPDGELKLYYRTGGVVREVEKASTPEEGESPYELVYEEQDGTIGVVFGADGKVYFQHPVSWSYYDGWIEGTLSADGKTITVPMGQYIAYTHSLEMAVQVAAFLYDETAGTYLYEPSVTELIYTINDDGSIKQEDTDEYIILGTMNRAFGEQFQYLDYEWLQAGDYASVYIPAAEQPLFPPEDLVTESFYLTTANNDGAEWEALNTTVRMGFDGDNVWLQGISKYLPSAWIHGTRDGNTITFPDGQLLGSFETLLYFKAAEFNPLNGNTTQKDLVLTYDGVDTYTTYDYVFITTDKNNLSFVNYYQGLTLSKHPDAVIEIPQGMRTEQYYYQFTTSYDGNSNVEDESIVIVGFDGDDVYIQGMWEVMPNAWVKGHLAGGKLVLDVPQYLGDYKQEYNLTYPIYLVAFDSTTGRIVPQLQFDYNPQTHVFSNQSTPYGMGINKTGYLNLQDFTGATLRPINAVSFIPGDVDGSGAVTIDDVTALIDILLKGTDAPAAADVDGSGAVTIDDVTALIDMLLKGV